MIISCTKPCVLVENFRGLTASSARLPTLFGLSPLECMNQYQVFHPKECLALLAITRYKFFYFMQQWDSVRFSSTILSPLINHQMRCLISTIPSHPWNAMSLCICNVMHHCMSMSCHICDECHMDNLIHTFYYVSWTIILHAYNLQNKHSVQCQYISTNISTFIKQQLTKSCY